MILYADMFSGVSGDMILGALVDLGTPVDWLTQRLQGLLKGFKISAETVFKNHLKAVDLAVEATEQEPGHRHYKDIREMIEKSDLPEKVRRNSLEAFKKIALAESAIHGKDIDSIHFHEVGGIDSIVDIIGAFLSMDYLGIEKVYASDIPLGSGTIECAHGTIPVPVPATLAILKDTPIRSSDAKTEIVTPTGAAIIKTIAEGFGPMPQMLVKKIGYGAGKRDTGSKIPNLIRLVLGEAAGPDQNSHIHEEIISEIKTNIDDMSPELSGFLMETLFEVGALDVCFIPVQMKKNRPGLQMEVLCRKEDVQRLGEIILTQTTSIGIRTQDLKRLFLLRQICEINTRYGRIQAKKIIRPDGTGQYVPEFEAARKIAKDRGLTLKEIYTHFYEDIGKLDTKENTG